VYVVISGYGRKEKHDDCYYVKCERTWGRFWVL